MPFRVKGPQGHIPPTPCPALLPPAARWVYCYRFLSISRTLVNSCFAPCALLSYISSHSIERTGKTDTYCTGACWSGALETSTCLPSHRNTPHPPCLATPHCHRSRALGFRGRPYSINTQAFPRYSLIHPRARSSSALRDEQGPWSAEFPIVRE